MLTKIIKEATNQFIDIDFNNGWNVENNKLSIKYYDNEAYPVDASQIADIDIDDNDSDSDDDNYIYDGDEDADIWCDND